MTNWLGIGIVGLLGYEGLIALQETLERHQYYNEARVYCNKVHKPLLRIGMKRSPLEPPNGDVTLDLDPEVKSIPGGVWGDETKMPFADRQFGVCFNEHTMEHLKSVEEVKLAVKECVRVADYVVFLCPSPYSIFASAFVPTHNLRLLFEPEKNDILVKRNEYNTGLGWSLGVHGIGQVLVAQRTPPVVREWR